MGSLKGHLVPFTYHPPLRKRRLFISQDQTASWGYSSYDGYFDRITKPRENLRVVYPDGQVQVESKQILEHICYLCMEGISSQCYFEGILGMLLQRVTRIMIYCFERSHFSK